MGSLTGLAERGLMAEDWAEALAPVEKQITALGEFLRAEVASGHGYLPAGDRVFAAFRRPLAQVRVLVVGQDPYPTPGHPIGLSFAVERDVRPLPGSLRNIYRELADDLGTPVPSHGDLTAWTEQGVMLLNRVLTVRPGASASHRGRGWEEVTACAIEALVRRSATGEPGVPLAAILWGRDAQSLAPALGSVPWVASAHPSPLSASRGFFGSRPFSRVDRLLVDQGARPWSGLYRNDQSSRPIGPPCGEKPEIPGGPSYRAGVATCSPDLPDPTRPSRLIGTVDAARLVSQVLDYAIISLDPSGTIESWNAGAERLKGYSPERAIGQHFSMLYPAEDRRAGLPLRLLEKARTHGSVEHTGWRVRADGSRFWGNVIITALRDSEGEVAGFAKVTRDHTARRRFEEAREQFFATFAHDFRAPVHSISGYAEMLPMVEAEQRDDFIAKIQSNSERLGRMTTELVEHARMRAVDHDPIADWLDVRSLTLQTVDGLRPELGAHRVRVDAAAMQFVGDRGAMLRILENLLTNALKYSAEADTPVVVDAIEDGDEVSISVRDRGRGIDPADLPHIFEEFERGQLREDDGGSGLGLTSVKMLVNRQGGQISIASELGRGTTVTVRMPGRSPGPVGGA